MEKYKDFLFLSRQQSLNFGCIVEDKTSHSILHYVEKPETYVSPLINCGVYIFSQQIFSMLQVREKSTFTPKKFLLMKIIGLNYKPTVDCCWDISKPHLKT